MSTAVMPLAKPTRKGYTSGHTAIHAYEIDWGYVATEALKCGGNVLGWGLTGAGVSWYLGVGAAGGAAAGALYGITQCF